MASNSDKKRKSTAICNNNSNNSSNNSSYHKYNKTSSSYSSTIQNPKRGGPGILLTCETGREYKARREALQILQQDWEIHITTVTNTNITTATTTVPRNETLKNTTDTQPPLPETSARSSLDAEIAQLQKQQSRSRSTFSSSSSSPDSPFVIYETGCKGTVLILYQSPNTTRTVPPILTLTNNNESTTTVENISCNSGNIKTTSVEAGTQNEFNLDTNRTVTDEISKSEDTIKVEWDPLVVVKRIVEDMTLKSPQYTSSRYISRMIPIQRTCYATIEDISVVVQSLLEPIVARQNDTSMDHRNNATTTLTTSRNPSSNPSPFIQTTTFAIQEKRRFCNQMKRDALITAVGNVVGTVTKGYKNNNDIDNSINDISSNEWTVNLSQPDYTIWIDICKTVAGISIVPYLQSSYPKNFNLVEHRISLLNNAEEPDTEDIEPHPSKAVTKDIS